MRASAVSVCYSYNPVPFISGWEWNVIWIFSIYFFTPSHPFFLYFATVCYFHRLFTLFLNFAIPGAIRLFHLVCSFTKRWPLLCHNPVINSRHHFVFYTLAAYKVCARDAYIFHWLDSVIGGRRLGALDFRGCSRSYVSRLWSAGTRGSILLSCEIKSQSRAALAYTKPGIRSQGHPMVAAVLRDTWCVSRLKRSFMFEFPCIISLYYIKNQQDATLAVLFISNCKITLHVSDAFCVHHQEH